MKTTFKVRTPGSCGEFIQGFYGGQEMLISYGIDLYSDVIFREGAYEANIMGRKTAQAIDLFFEKTGCSRELLNRYQVEVCNQIPLGKGMASSTADIAGVLYGLYHLYEISINPEEIAKLCVAVEPTDSIIFESTTLFDHINGDKIISFPWLMDLDVLVLEPDYQINTTDFRKAKKEQISNKSPSKALALFKEGMTSQSIQKICEATFLSAKENQEILEKPYLMEIYNTMASFGCYGINVAHSGSVIGVLMDKKRVDINQLLNALKAKGCLSYYKKQYVVKMIPGGSQLMEV
jgi:L-threonine kinase